MQILAECTNNCTLLRSYVGLMTDVPHILFELTLELITLVIGIALGAALKPIHRFRASIHREIDMEHGVDHDQSPVRAGREWDNLPALSVPSGQSAAQR